jgi:hypothetical protein
MTDRPAMTTITPSSVDLIARLFKEHHRNSCYPYASDFEAQEFAEAVIAALRVEPPSDVAPECIKQLRDHQQQLDPHGEMVGVPRQALDETFDFIISLQRQIAERDEALREARGFITERGKLDLDWDAVAETSDILAKLSALIGNGEVSDGQP